MAEQTVLVAIDIGTTKVCALIGEMAARGGVDVIGIGQAASDGLRKGVVIDIDRTVQSFMAAVEAAERISGLKVRSAFVGISGSHISSQNSRGMVAVSGSSRHDVDRGDTVRAIEAARAVSIPNTREILHVVPRGYVVDGQEGVRDPIGMTAVRLEVETHIVTASSTSVQNLTKCVQRAGVEIDELVLAPLATAEATLNDEDRELGVCRADRGGDTTDVAIFQDGSISHCATIPMGGRSVTADLGILLRVTPDVAESVKFRYGSAMPMDVGPDEVLQVTSIGEETSHGVTRRHIAEIVESRVTETLKFVGAVIEAAGATNRLQAGLVLTGVGSHRADVTSGAQDQLGMSARVVGPRGLGRLPDQNPTPAYSAASGLQLWGADHGAPDQDRASARSLDGVTSRLGKIFKGLMP